MPPAKHAQLFGARPGCTARAAIEPSPCRITTSGMPTPSRSSALSHAARVGSCCSSRRTSVSSRADFAHSPLAAGTLPAETLAGHWPVVGVPRARWLVTPLLARSRRRRARAGQRSGSEGGSSLKPVAKYLERRSASQGREELYGSACHDCYQCRQVGRRLISPRSADTERRALDAGRLARTYGVLRCPSPRGSCAARTEQGRRCTRCAVSRGFGQGRPVEARP